MLSFFKSSKNKIPKKGKSFYDRENLIQTTKELSNVLNCLSSTKTSKTNSNILFQNIELNAISEKNLEKDFGEKSYCLEPNSGIPDHRIYYFRVTSKHLKILIQIHFVAEQFFFAASKVYSDALLTTSDKQNVRNQIISKYHPDIDDSSFDIDIVDPMGNILFTQDNVFFYMKYIANNSTSQHLKKQYSLNQTPKSSDETEDTLNKLI